MSDDSGEMTAAAFGLGLPHPPGYPLFNLAAHCFTWIPVGTPAFRLNLFSQTLALASLGIIFQSCRRVTVAFRGLGQEILLMVLGIVFISYRSLFAQSLTAKGAVYTLTLLFCVLLAALKIQGENNSDEKFLVITAFYLWAVGMGNHWQTQILWLPFLLVWGFHFRENWSLKNLFLTASITLTGFSIYLYLPMRAALHPGICWGNPVHWKGFLWVVSRRLAAGGEFGTGGGPLSGARLLEVAWIFIFNWLPGLFLVACAGFYFMWKKRRELAVSLLLLFAPVFLSILLFALYEQNRLYLVNVYFVSTSGLVLIFVFYGANHLRTHKPTQGWIIPIFFLGSLFWLLKVDGWENKSRYFLAEDFGKNSLRNIPRGSIFLAEGDHYVFPIFYQREAQEIRRDIAFEPSVFLLHDWGWTQWGRQNLFIERVLKETHAFGDRLEGIAGAGSSGGFFYSLQTQKLWPVLHSFPGNWDPNGLVLKWNPRPEKPETLLQRTLESVKGQRLRGLEEFHFFPGLDFSSGEIFQYYGDQYFLPARELLGRGREEQALLLFERGLTFKKEAGALNDLAVLMGKRGYPELARFLCGLAFQIDPSYLPGAINTAKAFEMEGNLIQAADILRKTERSSGNSKGLEERIKGIELILASGKKIPGIHRTKTEYEVLGENFKKNGLFFLAAAAFKTSTGMLPEAP